MTDSPVYILGISAYYHDASACLVKDGVVVAAALEERFTRKKHDDDFPVNAVQFCLEQARISVEQLDYVAYYEKPILKFDRMLETFIQTAPKGFWPFRMAIKSWLSKKMWISSVIRKELGYKGKVLYGNHHESHAASSYFTSGFDRAAFLTMDGVGEKATVTYGVANGNQLTTRKVIAFPHSLGLLYTAFTWYCGFRVNSGEYKLMGLAPYGKPHYVDKIKEHLVSLRPDGSFELNMQYFSFEYTFKMINQQFCDLFGAPARTPESEMTSFYQDMAASIQSVTEEIVLNLAREVKRSTGEENLCLAGGVALNCVANGILQKEKIFKNIWIQPAAGDGGASLGVALQVWHQFLGNPKTKSPDALPVHTFLGPGFSPGYIEQLLNQNSVQYQVLSSDAMAREVATCLSQKKVVGWFKGSMEFGPRALGNRSVLASPQFEDMQHFVNLKIKKREEFRPFAPIVMEEHADDWFEMPSTSKTMLFTYPCKQPKKIPSCVHVDGSSRVQTLAKEDHPELHRLMQEFYKQTKCPVLINTSFNVRGEPIVCTPEDALGCFFNTEMDVLVLENCLLLKETQTDPVMNHWKTNVAYELD